MIFFCKLGLHDWDNPKVEDMEHRPCYRYKTCKSCHKEEHVEGWHNFELYGDVYYENITHTYGGDPIYTELESKQKKVCKDCKKMSIWTLK